MSFSLQPPRRRAREVGRAVWGAVLVGQAAVARPWGSFPREDRRKDLLLLHVENVGVNVSTSPKETSTACSTGRKPADLDILVQVHLTWYSSELQILRPPAAAPGARVLFVFFYPRPPFCTIGARRLDLYCAWTGGFYDDEA